MYLYLTIHISSFHHLDLATKKNQQSFVDIDRVQCALGSIEKYEERKVCLCQSSAPGLAPHTDRILVVIIIENNSVDVVSPEQLLVQPLKLNRAANRC